MMARGKTCTRVRESIEAYFEGVLAERESAIVASHLQECLSCAQELAQIERIALALEAVPQTEPQADLAQMISARIAGLPAPVSGRRLVAGWRRVEVLAAASIVLLAAWRYALPLLLSSEAAGVPVIGWLHVAAQFMMARLTALSIAGHDLWVALQGVSGALGLAAAKVAPILGLYAAGEMAIIATVVLLGQRAHKPRAASLTMLV